MILTYKYRIKDGSTSTRRALRNQARAVNFVWNYCCQIDKEASSRFKAGINCRRPTGYDLIKLCSGATKEIGIRSECLQAICLKFAKCRDTSFPKTPRFRNSKRNLDWIPFNKCVKFYKGNFKLLKRKYHFWQSRDLPDNGHKTFDISCDKRGRWYVNIQVQIAEHPKRNGSSIGIDLGIKILATLSSGEKFEHPKFFNKSEKQLALFQKRNQKKRYRALSAKIANQRKNFLHVVSTKIVRDNAEIYVGNVSPSKLGKTKMAKSIYDAGWTMLRNMLRYKSIATGAKCEIIPERFTSQVCSCCGTISSNSPKGMGGLGIRHWECSECGTLHDRDVNAALNILRVGLERQPLAGGISNNEKTLINPVIS